MNNKLENIGRVSLIGMPGSGKTTIGKQLAEKLGFVFLDTDGIVESSSQMSIPDIFEKHGEPYFRKLERDAVKQALEKSKAVIATGGGAVMDAENAELLKAKSVVIYLNRSCEKILESEINNRPLLSENPEKIYELFKNRKGVYEDICDFCINNDYHPEKTLVNILYILKK